MRVYYAGWDFDRLQAIADKLTDEDRKAGRPAPAHGYSLDAVKRAREVLRDEPRRATVMAL